MQMAEKHKALLLGGTAAGVGKSFLAAGICRFFARRGLLVAPFKGEDRSRATLRMLGGGEIACATALQAAACGLEPHVDMNPLLLKPVGAEAQQLWLQGLLRGTLMPGEYRNCRADFSALVQASCHRLLAQVDLVLIEGDGNLAESGLLEQDLANLKLVAAVPAAVILVADAERGGAFASLIGTVELLSADQRAQLQGVVINRAPADRRQLAAGIQQLEQRTGLPLLGVVPRLDMELEIPAASSAPMPEPALRIGIVRLPHGNSDELAAVLEREQDLQLVTVETPEQLQGLTLLLLPDSEAVRDDLEFLRQSDLATAIRAYHAAGGRVIGVGGGFPLLVERVADQQGHSAGLGLLDLEVRLEGRRQTRQVNARFQQAGYAAGFGGMADVAACLVEVAACDYGFLCRPLLQLAGHINDGAVSADGRVWGTGLRDLLADDRVRYALLAPLRAGRAVVPQGIAARQKLDAELDRLATELEKYLDLERISACLAL